MKDENKKATIEIVKIKDRKAKKWEPKKKVQFQESEVEKVVVLGKKLGFDTTKHIILHVVQKTSTLGILVKPNISEPIDMISMLSQITIKVPLSKFFRIEEHKRKVLSWLGGIGDNSNVVKQDVIQQTPLIMEDSGIVSQIPQIFLGDSLVSHIEDIDPLFLSLIINQKTLKNCMIDSGVSNTIMPFKVMEALALKVDTKQGRCRGMDAREVPVIGTITALPFKLATYPKLELTMLVLVVDIPPHYGMLLSRKWSVVMGGSLQYGLTYATFHIGDKAIKVDREPRVSHIQGEEIDKESTLFLGHWCKFF